MSDKTTVVTDLPAKFRGLTPKIAAFGVAAAAAAGVLYLLRDKSLEVTEEIQLDETPEA